MNTLVFSEALALYAQVVALEEQNRAIVLAGFSGDYSRHGELKCLEAANLRASMYQFMWSHGVCLDVAVRSGKKVRVLHPEKYTRGIPRNEQEVILSVLSA